MPKLLVIFDELPYDPAFLKMMEKYKKVAKKVIYISCPRPKGNEFQKLKKEGG